MSPSSDDVTSWHKAMAKLATAAPLGSGARGSVPVSQMLDEAAFVKIDSHAINTPSKCTATLAALAHHLTAPFPDELHKIRAIFCWVASHIAYDYKGYLSGVRGPQTAEAVLRTRVSVCEGYANLFLALCEQANCGLKAFKIAGAAMGVGLEAGDPCKPYFLVSPTQFIYSHIPKHDPANQFLSVPLTHKEWIELPHLGPSFRINGMRLVSATGHQKSNNMCLLSYLHINNDYLEIVVEVSTAKFAATGGLMMGQITYGNLGPISTVGKSLVWVDNPPHKDSLHDRGGQAMTMIVHSTKSPVQGRTYYHLRAYVPHGELVVRVMASISPSLTSCYPALTFRVNNCGPGKVPPAPVIYAGSVKLVEPITGQLKVGEKVHFKVQGPQEGIIMTPCKKILKFVREGDFQVLDVLIDSHGEWRVGHVNGRQYSFAGLYKA
ncbi:hypothetical protein BDR26DRAFT_859584 [Obelidium mucronatum]|nr:hypothetical protein BDR26DRAFT_859584 [Obelidium mucronatum]